MEVRNKTNNFSFSFLPFLNFLLSFKGNGGCGRGKMAGAAGLGGNGGVGGASAGMFYFTTKRNTSTD